MFDRHIITTADGSHTLHVPALQENYHSRHGAISESMAVYIQPGFVPLARTTHTLRVLEIGMGTGLNVWLTWQAAISAKQSVAYTAIEPYPLSPGEAQLLNYIPANAQADFMQLHTVAWEKSIMLDNLFSLQKLQVSLKNFSGFSNEFDLIYYDAFAPTVHPHLWTETYFTKMYSCLAYNGILMTYSSKSVVRQAMQAAGFTVTKIPGPRGKREIVRAQKTAPLPG